MAEGSRSRAGYQSALRKTRCAMGSRRTWVCDPRDSAGLRDSLGSKNCWVGWWKTGFGCYWAGPDEWKSILRIRFNMCDNSMANSLEKSRQGYQPTNSFLFKARKKAACIFQQDCVISGAWLWEIQAIEVEVSFSISPPTVKEGQKLCRWLGLCQWIGWLAVPYSFEGNIAKCQLSVRYSFFPNPLVLRCKSTSKKR